MMKKNKNMQNDYEAGINEYEEGIVDNDTEKEGDDYYDENSRMNSEGNILLTAKHHFSTICIFEFANAINNNLRLKICVVFLRNFKPLMLIN